MYIIALYSYILRTELNTIKLLNHKKPHMALGLCDLKNLKALRSQIASGSHFTHPLLFLPAHSGAHELGGVKWHRFG